LLHASFFFFSSRRRHTRSTRDWSSDVCSSDLSRLILDSQASSGLFPGDQSLPLVADDGLVQFPQVFEIFDSLAQAIQFVVNSADGKSSPGSPLSFRGENLTLKFFLFLPQLQLKSDSLPTE